MSAAREMVLQVEDREWLAAFTNGGTLTYKPTEHRALRARWSEVSSAVAAQRFPKLGDRLEPPLVRHSANDEDLPCDLDRRAEDMMAESSHDTLTKRLLEQIVALAPGLDVRLRSGICALDVGSGEGHALLCLAREFSRTRFMGYDLHPDTVQRAQELATELQLSNVAFYRWDAATMQDEGAFDLITAFDTIREQRDPAAVLSNIHLALTRGGMFLMQDSARSDLVRPHTSSLLTSLEATMRRERTVLEMIYEAGFRDVRIGKVQPDTMNAYYVCRKEER
jgi:SAM-dependent methyltransferase